jgi:hypothetical protein
MLLNNEYAGAILFVIFGIVLGMVLELFLKYAKLPIPYTVLVFFIGVALSQLTLAFTLSGSLLKNISDQSFSADLIVYAFLPTLLFSETMNLNW